MKSNHDETMDMDEFHKMQYVEAAEQFVKVSMM